MIPKLLFAPVNAIVVLAKNIQEQAETELYDLESIQRQLAQLYTLYEDSAMSDDEFDTEEQRLLDRYRMARQRQEEFLLQTSDD